MSAAEHIRLVADLHQRELELTSLEEVLNGFKEILNGLVDGLRMASTIDQVNIAAGIAHEQMQEIAANR